MDLLRTAAIPVNPVMNMELMAQRPSPLTPKNLEAIAEGFESMFVSMMLKEMRQSLETGSLFANDTGDVWGGMFDYYLGQHMAKNGSLGIKTLMESQMRTQRPT